MRHSHHLPAHASLLAILVLSACGQTASTTGAAAAQVTPLTHRGFPVATGPHGVGCVSCHGDYPPPTQTDCLGCHTSGPTGAVHTTTTGYLFASKSCVACHAPDPTSHPFDHKAITLCASCHQAGAFFSALPVPGFTHPTIGTTDCSGCHGTASWLNATAPAGVISDPGASVAVNALIATYSGTRILAFSRQLETLPMGMDHGTTEVDMVGLACSACHADAKVGVFFPGQLHSSLANLSQAAPVACRDCHAASVPTGFVGATATSPARTPASGEMKHDAVAWTAGAATSTALVTADCGACHVSPTANLAATWRTGTSGAARARYHAPLTAAGLAQPASCIDCHANTRPIGAVAMTSAGQPAGLSFDHVTAGATGDCAACHAGTTAWSGARYHLSGSTTPTSCLPCHAGQRPLSASGWTGAGYTASPFDYGTNSAGITHGNGQDCATCHTGPGTGGSWGGTQTFTGGHFTHGPASVATNSCIACHMSQRPDLVLGAVQAAAALGSFDHAVAGTGDCIGCHQATAAAGRYVDYFAPGGGFPGGDWKGAFDYPGSQLVSAPNRFVTVTEISLARPAAGALVTGTTSIQDTLYNAMLHTSAAIPAQISPGPDGAPNQGSCWHCHAHDASGTLTSYTNAVFHASLDGYSATVGGAVTPLPQPTAHCTDCHAQMRPSGVVELAGSDLQPMDHAALFTGTVTIAGQVVSGVAGLDCSTCHSSPSSTWGDGRFHSRIGTAVPADCVACHYPLMADGPRANLTSGTSYAMAHASTQLRFQSCGTCHTTVLAGSGTAPYLSTDWAPGAYHASLTTQPTACVDCHAVSMPTPNSPTQSSWTYTLAAGGTSSNAGQWMNHGSAAVAGLDCAVCHAADATRTGAAWSKADQVHTAVPKPAACQGCHGLTNGGGGVAGTNNNLPAGLTSSTTLTTASTDALTGVPAGTHDQLTHDDVNVSGHDCNFCHTQVGRSTVTGVQGAEWAKAKFHASFSAASPLLLNGTTGRCSNCHLNVMPGLTFTAQDHSGFTNAAGSQDCSACHSWPGTGGTTAPNWLGGGNMPQYIAVGGFAISQPPATAPTTQAGIANLPHPTLASGTSCTTCHSGSAGGKQAKGYDHVSPLGNAACSACHEAGSNLVGTTWNGATAEGSGAGDTRPFTLASVVAQKGGIGGDRCTVTAPNHFYPVQCGQCHAVPAGTGAVTTGTAYPRAWYFPHTTSKMTNPGTCNLCHTGSSCSK